jgi:hypothetical protein
MARPPGPTGKLIENNKIRKLEQEMRVWSPVIGYLGEASGFNTRSSQQLGMGSRWKRTFDKTISVTERGGPLIKPSHLPGSADASDQLTP